MNWKLVSPGIWKGEYRDFKCHKIQGRAKATAMRVDLHGEMIVTYEYSYVAIRAGSSSAAGPTRFAGSNWERIVEQIEHSTEATLF